MSKGTALLAWVLIILVTVAVLADYFDDLKQLNEIRDLQRRIAVLEQRVK